VADAPSSGTDPIGRRDVLRLAAAVGAGALPLAVSSRAAAGSWPVGAADAAAGPPSDRELLDRAGTCTMVRESIEGPYYLDAGMIRRDIREERPGTSLRLALRVLDTSRCAGGRGAGGRGGRPTPGALVELWQCDSGGVYSGFEAASLAAGGRPPRGPGGDEGDDDDEGDEGTSLRGTQLSDRGGIVRFTTIYPGWYPGRAVHVHIKVRSDARTLLTTQLYFDDELTDTVLTGSAYGGRTGRRTHNADDDFFDRTGLLDLHRRGRGYLGVLNLGYGRSSG
jgi:protocatechuate 3,4-dioxygenase beta subunit